MPKPTVTDAARASSRWVRRAGMSSQDYLDGSTATQRSQSGNARASRAVWVAQMTAPATHDRWARGLERAGDDAWRMGVREKGAQRYGPGVAASEAKFGGRIGRILGAIAAVDIPARSLPGSDQNFQRSRMIGQALNRLRGTFAN